MSVKKFHINKCDLLLCVRAEKEARRSHCDVSAGVIPQSTSCEYHSQRRRVGSHPVSTHTHTLLSGLCLRICVGCDVGGSVIMNQLLNRCRVLHFGTSTISLSVVFVGVVRKHGAHTHAQ